MTSVKITRRFREFTKHLWSQSIFFQLRSYLIAALALKPSEPLNIVKALSGASLIQDASLKLWPELASLLRTVANTDEFLKQFLIPVLGSCFARNALRSDHGKSTGMAD